MLAISGTTAAATATEEIEEEPRTHLCTSASQWPTTGAALRSLAVLFPFRRQPNSMDWDTLGLQLDAICRELRRLHMRLDKMQEATEDHKPGLLRLSQHTSQLDRRDAA